ncbi:glucosamine-6-phosphate deaminase [Cytobacillus sp. NCCP-133]|uniref:glucosamine-6-phosphate deaminase n=1 Tax=Cytobacillus sp. NCCP-133 TaxID=766848 RepID=UPI0022318FE4|nr:glucosamine-6-phosphate deaminase [Cytobacillus sp. NCCP-133]GLB60076.1 glucosamine-6-phosphate deaminase 1 [Cytobacillus sp. NCCP-133]
MDILKVKNYEEMSKTAAEYIIKEVRQYPSIKLGLATGSTPVGTYKHLIEDHKSNGTSYKDVTTFNLDEYIGLSGNHPSSYRYFMNSILFDHLDISKKNTYIPSGVANDMEKECFDYERLLDRRAGIDLQILGIGSNGHIGFNEPGTSFSSKTHLVDLAQSTREANARFFSNLDEVPDQAITMGISTIMKSKEILLLVSGEAKSEATKQLLAGNIAEQFPASILRKHTNVKIIADKAALAEIRVHS